ncbi:MAG: DUF4388 domain-containing protein [Acidimicrobiales bacterium]
MTMLQGSLDNFALDEVLGLLSSSAKTGRLDIDGDRGMGSVTIRRGALVEASVSGLASTDPEDVVFELLRFGDGSFAFESGTEESSTDPDGGDGCDIGGVLTAAQVRLADWRTIEAVVPSSRHQVTVVEELPVDEVTLDRTDWQVLRAVVTGTTVGGVSDVTGLGEIESSRRLKLLAERALVEITEPAPATGDEPHTAGPRLTEPAFAVSDTALDDMAFADTAVGDTALDYTALDYTALDDMAFADTAVGESSSVEVGRSGVEHVGSGVGHGAPASAASGEGPAPADPRWSTDVGSASTELVPPSLMPPDEPSTGDAPLGEPIPVATLLAEEAELPVPPALGGPAPAGTTDSELRPPVERRSRTYDETPGDVGGWSANHTWGDDAGHLLGDGTLPQRGAASTSRRDDATAPGGTAAAADPWGEGAVADATATDPWADPPLAEELDQTSELAVTRVPPPPGYDDPPADGPAPDPWASTVATSSTATDGGSTPWDRPVTAAGETSARDLWGSGDAPAGDPWASSRPDPAPAGDPWASSRPDPAPAGDPWASSGPASAPADPWASSHPDPAPAGAPDPDPWASSEPVAAPADLWGASGAVPDAPDPWGSMEDPAASTDARDGTSPLGGAPTGPEVEERTGDTTADDRPKKSGGLLMRYLRSDDQR